MTEKVESYFEKLERFSTADLDRSARELALIEKQNIARLIAHICEISKRKTHLECGYKNIFEYCVRRLNLSEGSVWRRLQVAGICWRFPLILVALSQNRLNLTTASLLAPCLNKDNVERLVTEAEGKSKREVEELVVGLKPRKEFLPSVRKQPARQGVPTQSVPAGAADSVPAPAGSDCVPSAPPGGESRRPRPVFEPATEASYN